MAQFPTIGFISTWPVYQGTSMDHYAHSLIQGISAAARDYRCNLLLGCGFSVTGKSPQHHSFWPVPGEDVDFVPVGPWNTNGLIIVPDELTESQLHYVRDLLDSGFPVIFTSPEGPGPVVCVDNKTGIRSAFFHLLEHGRRRIAFIAGNPGRGGDSEERLQAYRAALAEAGLPFVPALCAFGEHRKEGGAEAMRQILSSGEPFDGLIASNDLSCLGAVEVLQQAGFRIPSDIAVIGFDDILEARAVSPSLTTVRHPTFLLGYQAVTTLLEYIQNKQNGLKKVVVPTRLILRESCGCRSGRLEMSSLPVKAEEIVNQVASACFAEARNRPIEELQNFAARLLEAFRQSCLQQSSEAFLTTVEQAVQWSEMHEEDPRIWQAGTAVMLQNLVALTQSEPKIDPLLAAFYLDLARQEISEHIQKHATRAMVRYIQMMSQLGQLTAEMLSAVNVEQIAEILSRQLPKVGISNALVALYDTASEDPTAKGTVLFTAGFRQNFSNLTFNPRGFPIPQVYSFEGPLKLTILPLRIDDNLFGFVSFDAPNPELCAALVHNLAAALRTSRLYQDALEGRKAAEEASHLKSRFLSMVSHELRTPLSVIVGLSEMSLTNQSIDLKDIEQINANAQHLARLIGDVLDLASSEAGKLRILHEPLDLAEVLRVPARIGEEMARENGLEWTANLPQHGPWVIGDQTRLRQITLNLISNAVKFTPAGQIRLDVIPSGNSVSISVSDTGLGIPPTDLEKVFDEFYRSEKIVQSGLGGIGLGLAITKQLVDAHGGFITARSPGDLGCGSTFTVTLPIMLTKIEPPDFMPVKTSPGVNLVVLTENNESADQFKLHFQASKFSARIINVEKERDWISKVMEQLPEAILLSQNLASSRGWSLVRTIRQHQALENIPIFAFSLDPADSRGELLELNYLQKPVRAAQLSKELARLLPVRQPSQTVLIVDDDPAVLETHRRLVAQTGRRVLTAQDGHKGLELAISEKPDLILLDLMMPEMDGFAVMQALHSHPETRQIPVIILTGRQLTEIEIERLNRGVAGILSKGIFSAAETLDHIEAALTRRSPLNSITRQLVRRAAAIIHTRFAQPITREDIASQLNISPDYLTDCFRQEFGITPLTYLRRYRIKQACDLLLTTDQTITQIAVSVGFSDNAHFTHTFIREMGLSPRAFRHRNKK
ncbi:MAG: substrate-binding domain-containing protein [Chloroflexota bacterium]